MEDVLKGVRRAVVSHGVVVALGDRRPGKINPGEESLAAVIGEEFSVQLPIGRGLRVAPHRTSRGGCVATDFELRFQKVLKALVVDRNQHHIGRLTAELQAKGATAEGDEGRSAPAMAGAAGHYAASIF